MITHKLRGIDINRIVSMPLFLWIISISASILMWIYVTGMEEGIYITRKFTAMLEYRGMEAQAVLRNRVSEVDIELRGTEREMQMLDYNAVRAYVDCRYLTAGKRYTVNINVEMPSGINLVTITPSQVVLDVVRQVTRLMTVETLLPSDMPDGYYVDGAQIIPKEVGIRGAEDDVSKVGSVRITPQLEEMRSGKELLMPVKFSQSEPFEGVVAIEPAQVRFRGQLVRGLPRKRVPVNVRLSGLLNADYEVRSVVTDPSEVQIEGMADDIAGIDAVYTEVLDVSGMEADREIVTPLKVPEVEGVRIVNDTGVRVSIYLSEAHAERVMTNVPVELRSVEEMREWVITPSSVNVSIEGKPSSIGRFGDRGEAIRAYVDMSNIYMSPVTLPVRVEVLSGDEYRVTRIEPQNVTVNTLNAVK